MKELTNGIQALDLLGRKVIKDDGKAIFALIDEIDEACQNMTNGHTIKEAALSAAMCVRSLTYWLLKRVKTDTHLANASAVDYLHAVGYLCYAYMYVLIVNACDGKVGDFYDERLKLANYFAKRILPKLYAHADMARTESDSVMAFDDDFFG